ncbi:MAG TPA: polyprenol monophosphomannose synthase [Verrucomicrobiae bacterium]|nr:polyprenol monophosphomannose synthase [Verrucomicrobiae bacterium]
MKIIAVIPTYNERDNIEKLVPAVLAQDPGMQVLIVDDSSPDGTGDLVAAMAAEDPRIQLLRRKGKMGLGSAYREGFRLALQKGADYIVEMDADFSHDPSMLPVFFQKMRECDFVIGSRYLNGVSVVNWPLRRLMLSYFASAYTRFITGMRFSDCTSGFKCFRRDVLEVVELESMHSDGYSFQIEMSFRCVEKGFRGAEIPIIFIDRHAGTSKMSRKIVYEAIVMVWKLRLGSIFRRIFGGGRHAC